MDPLLRPILCQPSHLREGRSSITDRPIPLTRAPKHLAGCSGFVESGRQCSSQACPRLHGAITELSFLQVVSSSASLLCKRYLVTL